MSRTSNSRRARRAHLQRERVQLHVSIYNCGKAWEKYKQDEKFYALQKAEENPIPVVSDRDVMFQSNAMKYLPPYDSLTKADHDWNDTFHKCVTVS